jgi:hypothetical protein
MKKIQDRAVILADRSPPLLEIYFQWSDSLVYPVGEVSFICRIIDWRVVTHDSSTDGFTGFEVHAVDASRCTLLFQFPLPSCLLQRKSLYPWLQRGALFRIRHAAVREYDKKHDILIVLRTEHTTVELLSEQMASELSVEKDFSSLISRLGSFSPETEARRMASLRDGKEYFSVEGSKEGEGEGRDSSAVVMESCERRRYRGVRGPVASSGDGFVVWFNRQRHRLDGRIESQFRSSPTLRGEVLVANRRYLKESFQLEREESVILEYVPEL